MKLFCFELIKQTANILFSGDFYIKTLPVKLPVEFCLQDLLRDFVNWAFRPQTAKVVDRRRYDAFAVLRYEPLECSDEPLGLQP